MNKQLTRSTEDKWIAGICGGIAQYTGINANLIRLAAVVLTVVGVGTVIVVYIVAWFLMPRDDVSGPPVSPAPPANPAPPAPPSA